MASPVTVQSQANSALLENPRTYVPEDIKLWRISVEQYHAMIRSGAFDEDAPIELLEGWLVEKMPKSPSHALATDLVSEYLRTLLRPGWFVRTQDPITLADSEPEPDVCVIKGNPRQYAQQHPQATDIGLVIEISDSSLGKDRGSKKRIYAHAGISLYWIVSLIDRWIEVYSNPTWIDDEVDYQTHQVYRAEEQITIAIDESVLGTIQVRDLLPN